MSVPTLPAVRTLALDPVTDGFIATDGSLVYFLTRCCKASAKGGQYGTICRACYSPIDERLGMAWTVDEVEVGYLAWLEGSSCTEATEGVFAHLAALIAEQARS
jgi:hypothetical protein